MPSSRNAFATWNRKLHYYLGLYFLFFLWLFSLTGLMLNHQQWFPDIYNRAEYRYDRPIETPAGSTDLERAKAFAAQLDLEGEIDWPAAQPSGHIDFTVNRPDGAAQVRIDLNAKTAYVKEFDNTALHTFQILHTFSGTRANQPARQRDWFVTSLWVWAMDALAAGLVVMVLGSYYMWWQLKKTHALGFVALAAGTAGCAAFVAGLL